MMTVEVTVKMKMMETMFDITLTLRSMAPVLNALVRFCLDQ
jgi:hypothetical protein